MSTTLTNENEALRYIVINQRMFVYRITHYEKATNKAHLTLYKNPADFRTGKALKQITVDEWMGT